MDITTLENWLWEAACSIRGPLDAPKYKDYILPLLFYKRLCDVFEGELARLEAQFGDVGPCGSWWGAGADLAPAGYPRQPRGVGFRARGVGEAGRGRLPRFSKPRKSQSETQRAVGAVTPGEDVWAESEALRDHLLRHQSRSRLQQPVAIRIPQRLPHRTQLPADQTQHQGYHQRQVQDASARAHRSAPHRFQVPLRVRGR